MLERDLDAQGIDGDDVRGAARWTVLARLHVERVHVPGVPGHRLVLVDLDDVPDRAQHLAAGSLVDEALQSSAAVDDGP